MINKNESILTEGISDIIIEVIRKNEDLLHKYGKGILSEVLGLSDDAVGYELSLMDRNIEQYSMSFFSNHILMPSSHAIYVDLLCGNLTACFMQLRLMTESLSKCYLGDLKYPEKNFSHEKISILQQEKKSNNKDRPKSEVDFIAEFDKELGLKEETKKLYGKLSNDWIHTKGFVDRFRGESNISEYDSTKSILADIDNLHIRISQFRTILKAAMEKYKQSCSPII